MSTTKKRSAFIEFPDILSLAFWYRTELEGNIEDIVNDERNGGDEELPRPNENPKKKLKSGQNNGESLFELGGFRKVSVTNFKGKTYVNIREYYKDKASDEEKVGDTSFILYHVFWLIWFWKILSSYSQVKKELH